MYGEGVCVGGGEGGHVCILALYNNCCVIFKLGNHLTEEERE